MIGWNVRVMECELRVSGGEYEYKCVWSAVELEHGGV